MRATDPLLPTVCPMCGARALPRTIEVTHNQRTVLYDCAVGPHQWSETESNPSARRSRLFGRWRTFVRVHRTLAAEHADESSLSGGVRTVPLSRAFK